MSKKTLSKREKFNLAHDKMMAAMKKAQFQSPPGFDAVKFMRGHKSGMTDAMFKRMMKDD